MIRVIFLWFIFFVSIDGWAQMNIVYSEQEKLADKINMQASECISSNYSLKPVGYGGIVHEFVEKLSVSFEHSEVASIEKARKLIVNCVEKYLSFINSNSSIQPFLAENSLSPKDIELTIYFVQTNKDMNVGSVCCVKATKGTVKYKSWQDQNSLVPIMEESFEEAKKKLSEE